MKRLVALLFVVVSLACSGRVMALESAPVSSARTVASLITDTDAMHPGTPFRAALRLRLSDGWHTYWKNPGDAGVAPELTLELPEGTIQSPIDWPTPRRVQEGPVMTYAFTGDLLLPVTLTTRGDAPATIRAHAQWLVCKDICVPEEADFSLTLPLGQPAPSSQAPLFVAHDRTVPRPSPWAAHVASDGTLFVQGPELTSATVTDAWFIPEQPNRIQDDAAQPLSVRDGGFTLALRPAAGFDAAKPLGGVLSVRDRAGMQADVAVDAAPGPAPPPAMPPLPRVLAFAFLGGLILNLMPCVFPILAMKAVTLARNAGRGRAHAIAYAAGVLAMFVGLAGALLVARATGTAAGWGFQFASPVFVAAMTWLLLAVGLNLSGVFQVGGGGSLTNVGGGLADRHGAVGSFFTGLLAVLVATPCTAPFMAVAVAAGLAAPPAVTVLVFAMMGLGLASPYIALAELPGLVRVIPRPGRWMEVMKQALAFPMYGAAAWLLWVVSEEAGSVGVLVTATGAVLVGFAAWILGLGQTSSIHAGSSRSSSRTGEGRPSDAILRPDRRGGGGASGGGRIERHRSVGGARGFRPTGQRRRRGIHSGQTGSAAGARAAGVREHDGGVVRDVSGERAGGDRDRPGTAGVRGGGRRLFEGRLDPSGPCDHHVPAAKWSGWGTTVRVLPARRSSTAGSPADFDRGRGAAATADLVRFATGIAAGPVRRDESPPSYLVRGQIRQFGAVRPADHWIVGRKPSRQRSQHPTARLRSAAARRRRVLALVPRAR
jgi:DsbC/DsbD-like thiol-disulfide interchange protein/cytochrome c biogenesis protein CcdA